MDFFPILPCIKTYFLISPNTLIVTRLSWNAIWIKCQNTICPFVWTTTFPPKRPFRLLIFNICRHAFSIPQTMPTFINASAALTEDLVLCVYVVCIAHVAPEPRDISFTKDLTTSHTFGNHIFHAVFNLVRFTYPPPPFSPPPPPPLPSPHLLSQLFSSIL